MTNPFPVHLLERGQLRIVGLMSGTSGDGIDAARIELRERPGSLPELVGIEGRIDPFPEGIRVRLLRDLATVPDVETAARWDAQLGELFARSAERLIHDCGPADLIAVSGHTFCHLSGEGPARTLQLGNPAVVAERNRLPVVAGFRAADVARGGEGAPLVPAGDRVLFAEPGRNVVVINLGGIANLTWLAADGADPRGRDSGPSNLILDHLIRESTGARWDEGGCMAASGTVRGHLVDRFFEHSFFRPGAPRSTGRKEFGERWVQGESELTALPLPDQLATVVAWIAASVARGLKVLAAGERPDRILLAGGGAAHTALGRELARVLPVEPEVLELSSHGVSADLREAAAFAVLGNEYVRGRPGSFPTTTGCSHAGPLGALHLPSRVSYGTHPSLTS